LVAGAGGGTTFNKVKRALVLQQGQSKFLAETKRRDRGELTVEKRDQTIIGKSIRRQKGEGKKKDGERLQTR